MEFVTLSIKTVLHNLLGIGVQFNYYIATVFHLNDSSWIIVFKRAMKQFYFLLLNDLKSEVTPFSECPVQTSSVVYCVLNCVSQLMRKPQTTALECDSQAQLRSLLTMSTSKR